MFLSRDEANLKREIKRYLGSYGIVNPLETQVIFEVVFGVGRYWDQTDEEIPAERREEAFRLCEKRAGGYPLQYLAKSWPFLDFEIAVGEGVLIPRPDTESVAKYAIRALTGLSRPVVLDLCSGSGCIAIAIASKVPTANVTALEKSGEAFRYLTENTCRLASRVSAVLGDVFLFQDTLEDNSIDLIVSNPPYVTLLEYGTLAPELYYEPRQALTDEGDGLRFYRHIENAYYDRLKPGGHLVFEVGDGQSGADRGTAGTGSGRHPGIHARGAGYRSWHAAGNRCGPHGAQRRVHGRY